MTVNGDSNLVSANIKSGTSIFGVTGTLAGRDMLVRVGEYIATSGIQSLIINFGSTYAKWTVQFAYIHTGNQNLAANLKNKGDMIC